MPVDPNDIDLMARTMVAENTSGSPQEYAAIANVMRNRMNSGNAEFGGNTMPQVILARNQFTPWNDPSAKNYPTKINSKSPAYQSAYRIASDVMSGQGDDPTGGAVYYYNPKGVFKTPSFAAGRQGQRFGSHVFYPAMQKAQPDYADLLSPSPPTQPAQTANIGPSAPTTKQQGQQPDYADLLGGMPSSTTDGTTTTEPNRSGLFGEMGHQIQQHPYIAGGLAALGTAGLAAMAPELGLAGLVGGGLKLAGRVAPGAIATAVGLHPEYLTKPMHSLMQLIGLERTP